MALQQGSFNDEQDRVPARARFLRVKVLDANGRQSTNVRLPIRVARWGIKMAQTFSPELKDADLDWDAIAAMLEDGTPGELVRVEDGKDHSTVEVWVE